jgi:hypothetical protein
MARMLALTTDIWHKVQNSRSREIVTRSTFHPRIILRKLPSAKKDASHTNNRIAQPLQGAKAVTILLIQTLSLEAAILTI